MPVTQKAYDRATDYERIGAFLVETYRPGMASGNWTQPRWEYMHYHPNFDTSQLHRIRLWEDQGRLVAVSHYEGTLGEAFFQMRPGYEYLKPEMFSHAETELAGTADDGRKQLRVFINDFDVEFETIARDRGYVKNEERPQWESVYQIPEPMPTVELPDGFVLKSLADEYDMQKVHRVMWRGFNHSGEPPEEGIEWRRHKLSAPNLCLDLTIAVAAPNGDFVSFAGLWFEPTNKFAMVEPVATDPDYRRLGLGKAAVLEGIRRCQALGATVAYVGSGQKFYEAIGFKKLFATYIWVEVEIVGMHVLA